MAQTSVSIRMEEELKKQFEKFCSDVGLSMSGAFCLFAKAAIREQKIPFEISIKPTSTAQDPFFNAENLALLKKSIAQIEETGGTVHEVLSDD